MFKKSAVLRRSSIICLQIPLGLIFSYLLQWNSFKSVARHTHTLKNVRRTVQHPQGWTTALSCLQDRQQVERLVEEKADRKKVREGQTRKYISEKWGNLLKLRIIRDWCSTSSSQKNWCGFCANYPADIVIALSPDKSNGVFFSEKNKVTREGTTREVTLKQLFITRFCRVYFHSAFK